jgi:hypothetical protein
MTPTPTTKHMNAATSDKGIATTAATRRSTPVPR